MLSVASKPIMPSVNMLSVAAPFQAILIFGSKTEANSVVTPEGSRQAGARLPFKSK